MLTTRSNMSLAPYYYRPATPPEAAVDQLAHGAHSRNLSASSYCTDNTSPDSIFTGITTPSRSPTLRQHGPTLLPKIRTQDSGLEPSSAGGPKRTHRRVLSTAKNPPAFAPYSTTRPHIQRSVTEPVECTSLISPVSNASYFGSRASSAVPSPLPATASLIRKPSQSHARSVSASSIDDSVLNRYGYPTYRQMPVYVSQSSHTPSPTVYAPLYASYQQQLHLLDRPSFHIQSPADVHIDLTYDSRPSSMTPPPSVSSTSQSSLLTYLTEPTQPINLVRQLTLPTGRGLNNYFWWDVRNVRSWSSFSLDTISTIPGLLNLLNISHDSSSFPAAPSIGSTVTPASETDLANLITKIHFSKVNAATRLSIPEGSASLSLYTAPTPQDRSASSGAPHFLANYPHDADRTLSGLPRGRVVGLVKSFDRWNTGMRREGPARKVDYLNGLAHLQKCMRDHSCRYGFIMTEIELVCVRAGCDANGQPYFGHLELSDAVAMKTAMRKPAAAADGTITTPEPEEVPLTVSLALYYVLMLAKSTPLPGQAPSFMDVGGPGALTRQRVWDGADIAAAERGKDGKDKWIPEPQMGEKRDAKRARGWVWPADPWHKREGGGGARKGRF